jgi:4-amino-4-deoxy-L-arabinose transferase-like glycosyltransferase
MQRDATLQQPAIAEGMHAPVHPPVTGRRIGIARDQAAEVSRPLVALGLLGVALTAFVLRVLLIGQHSAFMDEGSYILGGRYLIEHGRIYADALEWTYGYYLWPLAAGAADIAGGLVLVRTLTAAFGTVMAIATAFAAMQLAPRDLSPARRWTVGLIAGLIMALAPAAIGIGRLGTYDAPAAAFFMTGVAILAAGLNAGKGRYLLAGAALFFIAFLTKYLVAIFFPFVCLFLLLSPRNRRAFVRNLLWFVLPLSLACIAYAAFYHVELQALLVHATTTSMNDLRSPRPFDIYLWRRPDVWLLAALAALAWSRMTRSGRVAAFGGAGVILAFHLVTRADHDWWKHSVYAIFFLAAPAALVLAPLAASLVRFVLAAFGWRHATGTERVVALAGAAALVAVQIRLWPQDRFPLPVLLALIALSLVAGLALAPLARRLLIGDGGRRPGGVLAPAVGVAAASGIVLPLLLGAALGNTIDTTTGYPNVNPWLGPIRDQTAGATTILTDDSILRYYLYRENAADPDAQHVTDPFWIDYYGQQGLDGYRAAIADRHFDAIVLNGGVGPIAALLHNELGGLIDEHYDRVYHDERGDAWIAIFRPREQVGATASDAPNARVYRFDAGAPGWGARPENGNIVPGMSVSVSEDRLLDGVPTLLFTPREGASVLAVKHGGTVSKITAQVYIAPGDGSEEGITPGIFGFDQDWRWQDNGFRQQVRLGRWTTLTWELPEPRVLNEIGLKFEPADVSRVYIGAVTVEP